MMDTKLSEIRFRETLRLTSLFDGVKDLLYLKESASGLRSALKAAKHYLVDEIWPQYSKTAKDVEGSKEQVIDFLRDPRVLKVLGVDPKHDDINAQLSNPQKYRPTFNGFNKGAPPSSPYIGPDNNKKVGVYIQSSFKHQRLQKHVDPINTDIAFF